MVHLLGAEALHFEYPTQQVLESVTMGVSAGDRIGIVGRNGDGKSTVMKLLTGRLEPDSGKVTIRHNTTIGMLDQSDRLGVSAGERIGIVGRNGDGKSTLMKLLTGRLEPDSGKVTIRHNTTIGMLDQSDTVDTTLTVGQAIVGDLAEHEWASDPKIRDVIS